MNVHERLAHVLGVIAIGVLLEFSFFTRATSSRVDAAVLAARDAASGLTRVDDRVVRKQESTVGVGDEEVQEAHLRSYSRILKDPCR